MPVITVQGIPHNIFKRRLTKFCDELIDSTSQIEELNLTKNDVSCFFPVDLLIKGLGEEIIITVDGLFSKPERTSEARSKLAKSLANCGKKHFPKAKIECFIHPFNPEDGFHVV